MLDVDALFYQKTKMKKHYVAILTFLCLGAHAQVTQIGSDSLLDIGCWNIEWFGDATNGPSDELLQYTNVKNILNNTDIDIWGLAEVSNPTTFNSLLTEMVKYDAVVSTFSQTQKTALIWKKNKFDVINSGNILTESIYNYDFAGRPPLEVVLRSKDTLPTDTFYCYVLHLKANTGNQSEKESSYTRRKNAAGYLKTFLDQNRKQKKVIVLGDWNDDLDESIVSVNGNYLVSPFANFISDSSRYFYPSLWLTTSNKQSTVSFPNMIDHHLISSSLKDSFYIQNSALVMTQTASQIPNFGNSTSDHYPILSKYNMKRTTKPLPTGLVEVIPNSIVVFPNPASYTVSIQSHYPVLKLMLYSSNGQFIDVIYKHQQLDVSALPNGLYTLLIDTEKGKTVHRLLINH
jgi:exonuclease III